MKAYKNVKFAKKCPELNAICIKSISYSRVDDERKYNRLLRKLNSHNCDFGSQMWVTRFNFQKNHGNPTSGEPYYYSPQSGLKKRFLRGSVKKVFLKILQNSQENTCISVSVLIKLRKRLWHRCFSARTPFLQNTSSGLLMYVIGGRKT